ncbi:MAG: hypothetical protein AAF495_10345 [Pseudomonadota bacterium]
MFHGEMDLATAQGLKIPAIDDAAYKAVTKKGLQILDSLRGKDHSSNLAKNKRYDQILYYANHTSVFSEEAGVLDSICERLASPPPGGGLPGDQNQEGFHLPAIRPSSLVDRSRPGRTTNAWTR